MSDRDDWRFAAEDVLNDEDGDSPGDWHPRTVYLARAVLALLAVSDQPNEPGERDE